MITTGFHVSNSDSCVKTSDMSHRQFILNEKIGH